MAAIVASLHHIEVPSTTHPSMAVLMIQLSTAENMMKMMDVKSPVIHRICVLLREEVAGFGARPMVTLHHDLHLDNFIVSQAGVVLLDLDNLAFGDPAYDLGRLFSASLCGQLCPR